MASHKSDDESIGGVFARLVQNAKEYCRAQLSYYRALATERMGDVRSGVIAAAIAITLGFAATITLLVGLVLTLAPVIGPLGATGVVVALALGIAAICGWAAVGSFRRAFRPPSGGEE